MQDGVIGRREAEGAPPPVAVDEDDRNHEKLRHKLEALVGAREAEAEEQVKKKADIEQRWLEDLRQFHGRYDEDTEKKLKDQKLSRVFVNMTRPKTNGWDARLSDMLFPTDDRNWGVKPTPVPDIVQPQAPQRPPQGLEGEEGGEEATPTEQEIARASCDLMQTEIEDQLREARYNIKCRQVIRDGVQIGSGIIKGPVTAAKARRSWQRGQEDGSSQALPFELTEQTGKPSPDFYRVDPWNYFPDMSARNQEEKEFDYERHLMNRKQLRKLAGKPGFDKETIRALLEEGPQKNVPGYVASLRAITGAGSEKLDDRYVVWEYHGSLENDEIRDVCSCIGDDGSLEDMADDPLVEHHVIMWFCQGRLLKFGLHPLDSGESLYSVFNLEKDENSIFGFGVAYLMRDAQAAINGAWRMTLDNAGFSVAPQIVVNKKMIEPENGKWVMEAKKVWILKEGANGTIRDAFHAVHIDSRQDQLEKIIVLARQFADDETNFPIIAQGEQGTHTTQTQGGMAMLMNSANVVFRRVVKNFDDDLTTLVISRTYDWNMQFNPREEIKGDFEVDARGSSVLLVREIQAQNLMAMAMQFSAHPVLGPLTKTPELFRKLVQAHMLPADEIVKTADEIAEEFAREQAAAEENPDPELRKEEIKLAIVEMDGRLKMQIEGMRQDTEMMKIGVNQDMNAEKLNAMLMDNQKKRESEERKFFAEIGVKERFGNGI